MKNNASSEKKKNVVEPNISKIFKNGKSQFFVHMVINGKQMRGFRDTLTEARDLRSSFKAIKKLGMADLKHLNALQIADVLKAFEALPEGMSLFDCVKAVSDKHVDVKSLADCIDDFKTLKEGSGVTSDYLTHLNKRIDALKKLGSFAEVDAASILELVKGMNLAPKTQKHYLAIFREFFAWCETRGYIKSTPFKQIHAADLPKVKKANPEVSSIASIKAFFAHAEASAPKWVSIYALVAFGGFRMAEALRLRTEDFDFKNKRITLTKEMSKTGQNWLQEGMPDNLWAWLKKYPPSEKWQEHKKRDYQTLNSKGLITSNGLRHAFATYHLSLYRDAPRTSLLMRHTEPRTLWQNYLGGLLSATKAKSYFEIKPIAKG